MIGVVIFKRKEYSPLEIYAEVQRDNIIRYLGSAEERKKWSGV